MSARGARGRTMTGDPVWQRLEFGSYSADLPLWEELAAGVESTAAEHGPVLELGAGAGRVALHLARRGHAVVALERSSELAAELARRAEEDDLPIEVLRADLERSDGGELPRPVGAAIAPLHVIQQLEPGGRRSLLGALARALPSGARLGVTVVDDASLLGGQIEADPIPEMRDLEGWVYSSEPLWVQVEEGEIRVRRLRNRVGPDGALERAVHDEVLHRLPPERLEAEAAEAGLAALERRQLCTDRSEADSIAVILEAS